MADNVISFAETAAGELPGFDKEKITDLYNSHPQLRTAFRHAVELTEQIQTNPHAYQMIGGPIIHLDLDRESVVSTGSSSYDQLTFHDVLGKFVTALGAVNPMANLCKQIYREQQRDYFTELDTTEHAMMVLWAVRGWFQGLSCFCMAFRLSLAQSGFLTYLVEDLKHMKHLSAEALEIGTCAYNNAIGTIFNCCRHPGVVDLLRPLNLVPDLLPFTDRPIFVIKGLAFITIAFLARDEELEAVRLDCNTVQYFLDGVVQSFESKGQQSEGWQTDAVIHGLSRFARHPDNRCYIVAQGGCKTLLQILQQGNEVQRDVTMDAFEELAKDPINLWIFQRDRQLMQSLRSVENDQGCPKFRQQAHALLAMATNIQQAQEGATGESGSEQDTEFLRENFNAMNILDKGDVEYVVDQLKYLTTSTCLATDPERSEEKSTGRQVIEALFHMAQDDNKKREIFARGGLGFLMRYIHKSNDQEKEMVLRVITRLASNSQYCEILTSHQGLAETIRDLTQSDNAVTSQAAGRLQRVIMGGHFQQTV